MSFDVPFIRPRMPSVTEIAEDYESIVASNWFSNFGPKERELARRLGEYVDGGVTAVTMNNATTALIALVHSLLGRGDGSRRVIVPSFTFAAGPAAIEWCGYVPIFVDIEPDGLQPDLEQARQALSSDRTIAAILLCNTFGIGNARIAEWEQLAGEYEIPLIVDSAAGFGSRYSDGRLLGAAGSAEVFSLHVTKPFAIGEGGVVTTRDLDLAQKLERFQNFGFGPGRAAEDLGTNGKLAEIMAAIGLRQLAGIDRAIASRQDVVRAYREALPTGWRMPTGLGASSVCFATLIALDRTSRDDAFARLMRAGVEVRRYYEPAVHRQPHFAGFEQVAPLKVTEDISDRVISLPVHEEMEASALVKVVSALTQASS